LVWWDKRNPQLIRGEGATVACMIVTGIIIENGWGGVKNKHALMKSQTLGISSIVHT